MSASTTTVRIVRAITEFDQRLDALQNAFLVAREQVLKDDESADFVGCVIKCMQAVNASKFTMYDHEKNDMIVNLVKDVVNSSPKINEDQKMLIRGCGFQMIEDLIIALSAASWGELYLRHKINKPAANRSRAAKDVAVPEVVVTPAATPDINGLVDDVYNTLKLILRMKEVTIVNVVSIATTTMQIIEQYPQLSGAQKKMTALLVLHRVVDGLDKDEETKAALSLAIDTIVAKAIDFIIAASRGDVQFVNDIQEKVSGCIAKCTKKA
jgi:hypothetical protein